MSAERRILPGFGISLGFTLFYLGLLVLLPLSTLFFKSAGLGWDGFWAAATSPRVMASYRVSLLTAFAAASILMLVRHFNTAQAERLARAAQ